MIGNSFVHNAEYDGKVEGFSPIKSKAATFVVAAFDFNEK
jgi:hypothetical protein